MTTLESELERRFRDLVRRSGGISRKLVPTVKGTPDRLIITRDGRVLFVELKTETGTLSAAQRLQHARYAELGVNVVTLYGWDQIKTWASTAL